MLQTCRRLLQPGVPGQAAQMLRCWGAAGFSSDKDSPPSSSPPPPLPGADPFTSQLQQKVEEQLKGMGREQDGQGGAGNDEEEGQVNHNPSTGEVGGPKGPEPTRYGDWEKGGRCSDF